MMKKFVQYTYLMVKEQWKHWNVKISFAVMTVLVLVSFVRDVFLYRGSDILYMIEPTRLLLNSFDRTNELADIVMIFIMLYPILVAWCAGDIHWRSSMNGTDYYLAERIGIVLECVCSIAATFFVTAMVIGGPLLIHFVLNLIAFPASATGNLMGYSYYDTDLQSYIANYLWSNLYIKSAELYAMAGIFQISVFSGLLGAAVTACSYLFRVRYRIFLILPAFLYLQLTVILTPSHAGATQNWCWYDYVFLFDETPKLAWHGLLLCVLPVVVIVFAIWKRKKENSIL